MKIFYNASFITMNKPDETAAALAVHDGKILKLYDSKPDINAEYVDLKGKFVLPGFIDTHTHSNAGGFYSMGVNLEGCRNLAELFERLAEAKPSGKQVVAWHLDEMQLSEKRFPLASELDNIFPQKNVLIRRVDGHSCVINSHAARQIPAIHPLSREFNGTFRKRQNDLIVNWFHKNLDDETIIAAYHFAALHAAKFGHTTVHTMIGDGYDSLEHYELLQNHLDDFPVEFILYPQSFNLKAALDAGAHRIGGCIIADGSFGSHTAALFEPYADQPQNYGTLYHSDDFWQKFINNAHENDLQVAVHCIGDRAITQIINCYEKVQQKNPKNLRHILIHNELTTDDMIKRIGNSNVTAAMQPMFDRLWAGENGLYQNVLGKERTMRTNRLKSLRDNGVIIGGGSDWYVTEMDALAGINAATQIHNNAERLSPFQALQLYTSHAAMISHDENRIGSLIPSAQADFVVLNDNPLLSQSIDTIKIAAVYKKGIKISH